MDKPLPPDLANQVIEIVTYVLTFIGGLVTRWLTGKKSSNNQKFKQ